ncbi:hypothetical protein CBL_10958 [Carabus blaptoides fortunei]
MDHECASQVPGQERGPLRPVSQQDDYQHQQRSLLTCPHAYMHVDRAVLNSSVRIFCVDGSHIIQTAGHMPARGRYHCAVICLSCDYGRKPRSFEIQRARPRLLRDLTRKLRGHLEGSYYCTLCAKYQQQQQLDSVMIDV